MSAPGTAPRRLMIVEDEALVAYDLKDMVEGMGHEVICLAATVDEALRRLDDAAPLPHAVLLDANLRGRSAAPVARRLRQLGIPFLLSSGYSREYLERAGLVAPTLGKPCRALQLERSLESLWAAH